MGHRNPIMSLNKFEKYILDTIGHERGRKWLLKIEALVHKYQNYRIRKELEAKRDAAVRIFKANPGLSRKDMIAKFVAEANMTPAGAATYYQSFKSKGV